MESANQESCPLIKLHVSALSLPKFCVHMHMHITQNTVWFDTVNARMFRKGKRVFALSGKRGGNAPLALPLSGYVGGQGHQHIGIYIVNA